MVYGSNLANPTEEQINSINFIIDNSDRIKQSHVKAWEIEYPRLKETYGYDENDEDSREWFPDINSIDEFEKIYCFTKRTLPRVSSSKKNNKV
jgi:hypothetical protein